MDLTEFDKKGEIDDEIKDNGTHDGENTGENGSPAASPSPPAAATKGRGLRKWRRIRRESGKETSSGFDSNRKRGPIAIPIGTKQKSEGLEGSSSSTNAVFNRNNNGPVSAGDLGSDFGTRADSENSEDRNSRSSTGASVPRLKNPEPVVIGKGSVKLSGDNQQGKGRGELTNNKKARGVKIKKENSISSVESDSRSNFVFNRGVNGGGNFRSGNYDEDYSDDGRNGGDRCLNEEGQNGNDGDFEGISRDDLGAENSWEVKEEKVDKEKSEDRDDLTQSVMPLHLAQEALERELEKLRDVGKEDSFSEDTKISELESVLNYENMKFEHEEILKQRIAAEIEFLVILDTIQNLKTGCKDQIDLMVTQKNVSVSEPEPEPVPVPEKVKVEDEGESARKLRKRVWRYGFWFVIQLVLFIVVVYLLVLQFSSQNMEVLPT